MNTDYAFTSRRSPVVGRRGMVATTQPLAVAAGLEILAQGGNAADAAIATAAALNVTEPTSTGIGGDAFALYYEAATGQITALNASGRTPASLTSTRSKKTGLFTDPTIANRRSLSPLHGYGSWGLFRLVRLIERHGRLAAIRCIGSCHSTGGGRLPGGTNHSLFLGRGCRTSTGTSPQWERIDH